MSLRPVKQMLRSPSAEQTWIICEGDKIAMSLCPCCYGPMKSEAAAQRVINEMERLKGKEDEVSGEGDG